MTDKLGANKPWNSSWAESTDDRPLCSATTDRPVLADKQPSQMNLSDCSTPYS